MHSSKFVCWACRKVLKGHATCPDCHGPMVDMGTRWRPPRRQAVKRWAEQQRLYEGGYRPDGRVSRLQREYVQCRWCGGRDDRAHDDLVDTARGPHWYRRRGKLQSIIYQKKKEI